ncbi:hypothetical protein VP1G_09154 [Cytospora mali]|uniref:Uncharacterized protein n=1 Tax=Cytospora mali TaxID=578113 RepID=A0A194VDQ3_CYTMA|nr:hypothetical protein VP1G_09154 [Valsa mali var. pyri (nom. inval.)]
MPSADPVSSLPRYQTAIVAQGPGQLANQHNAPVPFLVPDIAIVKTAAVAINPVDAKILDYRAAPGAIYGYLQPDVGAFAEYVGACADLLLKPPHHMGFEEDASFGVGVVTSIIGIFDELRVPGSLEHLRAVEELPTPGAATIAQLGSAHTRRTSWPAALAVISETLRLELSPFGVTVVSVMGGAITSNFDVNNPEFSLPPDSHYAPIEDIIAGWASGKSKPVGGSAEDFAASLVGDILGYDHSPSPVDTEPNLS